MRVPRRNIKVISDAGYDGLALENETAFVEVLGQQFIIGSRQDAKAWLFSDHTKKEMEVISVEKMVPNPRPQGPKKERI